MERPARFGHKQAPAERFPRDGIIRVARERRRASSVTLIGGLGDAELADIAKILKRLCGTGGTSKNGIIELQGDHRDAVVTYLEAQGKRVKRAGG